MTECSPEAQQWETLLQCELRRPEVDLQDDYLEMAVQVCITTICVLYIKYTSNIALIV